MKMWRVTVSPKENRNAWRTYIDQSIIAIGWPDDSFENEPPVRRFRQIGIGDWIVAHVPQSYGGGDSLALGVGRVVADYEKKGRNEIPSSDQWRGAFRRQFRVKWLFLGELSLRDILNYYRGTVHQLTPQQASSILAACGLKDAPLM